MPSGSLCLHQLTPWHNPKTIPTQLTKDLKSPPLTTSWSRGSESSFDRQMESVYSHRKQGRE